MCFSGLAHLYWCGKTEPCCGISCSSASWAKCAIWWEGRPKYRWVHPAVQALLHLPCFFCSWRVGEMQCLKGSSFLQNILYSQQNLSRNRVPRVSKHARELLGHPNLCPKYLRKQPSLSQVTNHDGAGETASTYRQLLACSCSYLYISFPFQIVYLLNYPSSARIVGQCREIWLKQEVPSKHTKT